MNRQTENRRRRQRGVTLIEMMVVVTIIALFSALVLPKMFRRADAARQTAARAQINGFMTALGAYKLDTSTFPTTEQGLAGASNGSRRRDVVEGSLPAAGSPDGSLEQALRLQVPWRAWRRAGYHFAGRRRSAGRRRHQRRYPELEESVLVFCDEQCKSTSAQLGITLVEMMIVLAIIGLITAISFPSVTSGLGFGPPVRRFGFDCEFLERRAE